MEDGMEARTSGLNSSTTMRLRAFHLTFNSIDLRVNDRVSGTTKLILQGVHGQARNGRLLAVMGPSGAGKTTLLDVLAGNSMPGCKMEGQIQVNGLAASKRSIKKQCCYVQQKDVILSSATVREAVTTSAYLKLPRDMPYSDKRKRVEAVLKELDLLSCADTLVGDEAIGLKGISGGQKRRLSVGIELVKDPTVMFLDEPTSGLDSEMAAQVILSLLKLARRQRTIVCTIHQPNSDITDCFDDFLLMAGGRVVYGGPYSGAIPAFAAQGYPCPSYKNPTEYFMSLMRNDEEAVEKMLAADEALQALICPVSPAVSRSSIFARIKLGSTKLASWDGGWHLGDGRASAPASPSPSARHAAASAAATAAAVAAAVAALDVMHTLEGSPRSGGVGGLVATQLHSPISAPPSPLYSASRSSAYLLPANPLGREGLSEVGPSPLREVADSTVSIQMRGDSSVDGDSMAGVDEEDEEEEEVFLGVPIWDQVAILVVRNLRTWMRSPIMLISELMQYIFVAVFVGLMYLNSFTLELPGGAYNRVACIWFCLAILCFTPSYTAVTTWDRERQLLRRELSQQQYSLLAHQIARSVVMYPFEAVQCGLFLLIMYWFVGFQSNAQNFFVMYAALFMFQVISEGVGLVCAIVTKQASMGAIILTFALLTVMSFSGFLIAKVPIYFVWVYDVSFLTYAYAAIARQEFEGLTFHTATGELVHGVDALSSSVNNGLSVRQDLAILGAMTLGTEVIKYIALVAACRFNKL